MITISVVMPTYNTPVDILREAVESILWQTFRDFEFIIIDDGSTNDSVDYLNRLEDKRIRLIRNPENIGITKSLNIGFRAAQGKYIARMDSDDISLPARLEKQYAFMEIHPDAIACGTGYELIGAVNGKRPGESIKTEDYRVKMLFANPGPIHPTAFFVREKLVKHQVWYDESLPFAQDYGLWAEICRYGKVCVLPDILLQHRIHSNQVSKQHRERQIQCDKAVQKKLLEELLGPISASELDAHYFHSTGYYHEALISPEIATWYERLIYANKSACFYDERALKRRIILIKKRLIHQSFTTSMSKTAKIMLFFHYLPFEPAIEATIEICWMKINSLVKKPN